MMARPRLATPSRKYRVTLCLRDGEDDDLITFLDSIPARGRAAAIVAALRAGGVDVVAEEMAEDDELLADSLMDMML